MKYIVCMFLLFFGADSEQPPKGWTSKQNGQELDMRPGNLPANRLFVYTLFPAQESSEALTDWLAEETKKDAARYGTLKQAFIPETIDDIETLTGKVQKSGKQRVLMYMAFTANDRHWLARIVTEPDEKMYSRYLSQVAAHFLKIAHTEGVNMVPGVKRSTSTSSKQPTTIGMENRIVSTWKSNLQGSR